MSFLRKIFKRKVTSSELGEELFQYCMFFVKDMYDAFKETIDELECEKIVKDMRFAASEILCVNMWIVSRALHSDQFNKSLDHMHACYLDSVDESNREDAKVFITDRYEEYYNEFTEKNELVFCSKVLANIFNDGKVTGNYFDIFLIPPVVLVYMKNITEGAADHVKNIKIID